MEAVDVVVIGAGINGAAVCQAAAGAGYRVMLVDQGDIGGGTSQASTQLVWGGLLYLKDFELRTVRALCRERETLLAAHRDAVEPARVVYVPGRGGRSRLLVRAALTTYWLMGGRRRARPGAVDAFPEQPLLTDGNGDAYGFEEGTLVESDARFVLRWVLRAEAAGALIHTGTRVDACAYDRGDRQWRLDLTDTRTGRAASVRAACVVNAAGGWADEVNRRAGVETPFRHVLSRGVSLALPRDPCHTNHLVFDTDDGSALTLAPWGPVALWASTESLHGTMADAGRIAPHDLIYLIDHYNARFRATVDVGDVVSVRVGVRPVPVRRGQQVDPRGVGLSRHHRLHFDADRRWLSVYGGKLSGCLGLGAEAAALIASRLRPSSAPVAPGPSPATAAVAATTTFPGVAAPVVAPAWSRAHEHCRDLEDYLRRRTNIAQWVPRGGFGRHDEHAAAIQQLAQQIHEGDVGAATRDLLAYRARVDAQQQVLRAARELSSTSLGVPA